MKINCHLSFASQGPKPASLDRGGKYRCLAPIYCIWLPWSQNLKFQLWSTKPGVACHLLNVVWEKCLVSGRLPAIQSFCWGSSEPTQSSSCISVCEIHHSVNCLSNTAYFCTKSPVQYIFLPLVPPLEQATVTDVLGGAGGCWEKRGHCYWGRRLFFFCTCDCSTLDSWTFLLLEVGWLLPCCFMGETTFLSPLSIFIFLQVFYRYKIESSIWIRMLGETRQWRYLSETKL